MDLCLRARRLSNSSMLTGPNSGREAALEVRRRDGHVRLIDDGFDDAVCFLHELETLSFMGRLLYGAIHLSQLLASVDLVVSLPCANLPLERVGGRSMARELLARYSPKRVGMAVLEVGSGKQYLAGRSRQAVRTNSNRARRLGIATCELVSAVDRLHAFGEVLLAREPDRASGWPWLDCLAHSEKHRCFGCFDASGATLVVSAVNIHTTWAHVAWFLSKPGHFGTDDARFLLQVEMVAALSEAGVHYLVADQALRQPYGQRYLEHLLGYRPMNVRYVRPSSSDPVKVSVTAGIETGTRSSSTSLTPG